MATRFCSAEAGGGESGPVRACARSSLVTGFALPPSGLPDGAESAANALRVSGGPTAGTWDATGALVATAPMFGAAVGLDPTDAIAGVAVGNVCALEPPRPGASLCT